MHKMSQCGSGKARIQTQAPWLHTAQTPPSTHTLMHTQACIHEHTRPQTYAVSPGPPRLQATLRNKTSFPQTGCPGPHCSASLRPHCPHCIPAKHKPASLLMQEAVGCPVVMAMATSSRCLAGPLLHSQKLSLSLAPPLIDPFPGPRCFSSKVQAPFSWDEGTWEATCIPQRKFGQHRSGVH